MSDWERVQEVSLMAADVPVDQQPRLLDSLYGHDAELRFEVESLLASDCDSDSAISDAVQSASMWRGRMADTAKLLARLNTTLPAN